MPIEKQIEADGFRIRYCEAGAGNAVIMLHDDRGPGWSALHDLLAEHRRVIAPELPGFGSSPADQGPQSVREVARAVTAFAASLGLERYSLAATAFSAGIALWQAIDAPERIDTLVLISPAAILPDDWKLPADWPEPMAKLRRLNRDQELESHFGAIMIPVLVVFGTRNTLIPPEIGRLYRERIPNSYYILMYGAGHAIADERPQALYQLVGDFLERGDAFVVNRTNGLINP
ncbi:MAG TPA: alpha/beta fold hydrolase [Candidatus Binataceae bacterium]|nr:alpha/beta fold hydrolase [Candidatus Binataceae bacterium]